jgi:sec-independent protein translocase protein TatA
MEALTPWHLLLILVAFMLLAGYRKLPDAARSVGRSLRIFRGEMRALDDENPAAATASAAPDQTGGRAASTQEQASPQEQPAASAEDLEREAAAAEERAAQLRARATATREDRPDVS